MKIHTWKGADDKRHCELQEDSAPDDGWPALYASVSAATEDAAIEKALADAEAWLSRGLAEVRVERAERSKRKVEKERRVQLEQEKQGSLFSIGGAA